VTGAEGLPGKRLYSLFYEIKCALILSNLHQHRGALNDTSLETGLESIFASGASLVQLN
jgi:hypothetical protein